MAMKHTDPKSVTFSLFTAEEIRKLSVVKVCTPLAFNLVGHPLPGGLYDPALGPFSEHGDPCRTCYKNFFNCPGHMGHIELPLPVVNPMFYRHIYILLKLSCLNCHIMQIPGYMKHLLVTQLSLLQAGYLSEAQEAESLVSYSLSSHINNDDAAAQESFNLIVKQKLDEFQQTVISYHLRKLWPENCDFITAILPVLKTSSLQYPTDIFFMDLVSVPPPKTRPVNYIDNKMMEHAQTEVYKRILQDNMVLRNVIKLVQDGNTEDLTEEGKTVVGEARGNSPLEKFHFLWQQIQGHVDHLMDNNINQNIKSGKNVNGLKQASPCCPGCTGGKQYANVIEKKQGVIRMNMMGKRVNFAARSVITPDPNLNIDEVGVPQPFATALTYPSPVTTWNVGELREMITNGPTTYPGAVMVENYDGSKIKIPAHSKTQRESIAKRLLTHTENRDSKGIKVVHRHLRNGDILLLNRQPTLHKPSIMAHTARILQGEKTLRLHYANCKAYNADFDGDEMNAHFPQSELGRSEAYNLLNVNCQYVVPKDGTPLSGLIQDHVISGVRLSLRGVFFDREGYQQLVYQGLSNKRGDIELLPPAILKPARLWSGKQAKESSSSSEADIVTKCISAMLLPDHVSYHFVGHSAMLLPDHVSYHFVGHSAMLLPDHDSYHFVGHSAMLLPDHVSYHFVGHSAMLLPDHVSYHFVGHSAMLLTDSASYDFSGGLGEGKGEIYISPKCDGCCDMMQAWEVEKARPWKAGGTPFSEPNTMTEAEVIIRQGELLCGVLDKTHFGATPYGLVHCLYELYGGACSSRILSSFSKLFTFYLQRCGFTLGIEDILILDGAEQKRVEHILASRKVGDELVMSALELDESQAHNLKDEMERVYRTGVKGRAIIDRAYKTSLDTFTNNINTLVSSLGSSEVSGHLHK
uniref:DNA-directed RNA polymerase subunit n=1 Tax=Timema monikensis TaxID=170555 RepID=A0A7R9HQT4_9NEOP|nr:unnamed protein product [Timema monikensis]